MPEWTPPTEPTQSIRDFPPAPLTPLQIQNQDFIKSDPHLHKTIRSMQENARKKDMYQTLAFAAEVIENLTGRLGFESWILDKFDEKF